MPAWKKTATVLSIHKMLKDGIDTWAPKLPVERVIVDYPSLDEEMHVDLFQRSVIGCTLMSILEFSKVDVTIGHHPILPTCSEVDIQFIKLFEYFWDGILAQEILNRWVLYEERGGNVVMKGKVPFILPKTDFNNAYKDVLALWYGHEIADWIVYVTPILRQDYMGMCFTAAKLEKCIPSPPTSYAGYRTTLLEDSLLEKVRTRCLAVEGYTRYCEAAKLLGYTAEAVLDCIFSNNNMSRVGNTFVYLLNTQAKVRRITDDSCKDINVLKKASISSFFNASELILEKEEGWEKGEE
ncbi:arginine--tRNA ligase, chloroplastic/mitochondrial, partial [Tanacetum coccineum]